MNKRKQYITTTILFAVAIALILYPFVSSVWNAYVQEQEVAEYEENVSEITEEDYSQYIEEAQAWNQELYAYIEPSYFPEGLTNTEIYESLLNINGDGMMGYVVIPKISVNLPIYHYSTDDILAKGAGHLSASALPVGGDSTHCVITAHRGLPTAEMFTNLDQMEIGDVFYLKVLGETYAYEVSEITEVQPDETQTLLPVDGEDLCTLVTCTPYGVNSRRLLVTGTRTDYVEGEDVVEPSATVKSAQSNWFLLVIAFFEMIAYAYVMRRIAINQSENDPQSSSDPGSGAGAQGS